MNDFITHTNNCTSVHTIIGLFKLPALALAAFLFATGLSAQITSAVVTYQESLSLDFSNQKDMDPGMKALLSQLPKESTSTAELIFNERAAIYQDKPSSSEDMTAKKGNMSISFKFSESEPEIYYVDLTTQTTKQVRNIFDRSFQIEDQIETIEWTLMEATDTDKTSGLPIKKATAINAKGDTITAWYTPSIPVSTGPMTYGGLPGLIVRLESGNRTYQVTAIDLKKDVDVQAPFEKGKTITLEKFNKLQQEKTEAFQKNANSSMRVMTIGGE